LLLASLTTAADLIGALIMTVPVDGAPPATVDGLIVIDTRAGGVMVNPAVFFTAPSLAEIATEVDVETNEVETEKVAELWPAGTVTEPGTVAKPLDELRLTVSPPLPASPLNVTVPVEVAPAGTVVGDKLKPVRTGGLITRVAVWTAFPTDAWMKAVVC